jgi:molecular chaperone DnaK
MSNADDGSQRSLRSSAGTCRAVATDEADFARTVDRNTEGDRFFFPYPKPAPEGTTMMLEVVARESRERICLAEVIVKSERARPPGMLLGVLHIEPGCAEEVRRELERSLQRRRDPEGTPLGPVIGIDLGTTYTCAAIVENGTPKIIRSRLGYNTIPSMLTFDPEGVPIAGQIAERRLMLEPDQVVHGSKRIIGRTYSKGLMSQLADHMRYGVASDDEGMATIQLGRRKVSPTEVASCILAEIKKVAEGELQQPIRRAVITVPAAFTENQRSAVRVAAARAGLELLRIVNEPTAAALAFGYGGDEQKTVVVYDLGGGTFDVSILSMKGSVYTVLATAGDMFLGGVDFDRVMVSLLLGQLRDQVGAGVTLDRRSEERINSAAREAKHALSELQRTTVTLPKLRVEGAPTPTIEFTATVTREEFEAKASRHVDRTLKICEEALSIAQLEPSGVQDVLLVGGQTRMPLVSARVEALFKRKPSKRVHPDEVVALGAAILATMYETADAPVLHDVLPLPIGIAQPPEGVMKVVLARNLALPVAVTIELEVQPGEPLEIAVFQGEALRARDNEFLGSFTYPLPNLTAPEKVEVTFALSSECILTVRTKVLSTGVEGEHELTTRHTSDEVLQRIGKERVTVKATVSKDAPAAKPAAAAALPPAAGRPEDTGGVWGFFRKLAFWR